jgi:hypothetical protein
MMECGGKNREVGSDSPETVDSAQGNRSEREEVAQCFYSWRELYPELKVLLDNIDVIKEESQTIGQVLGVSFISIKLHRA